jgi:hypothetical protein
LFNCLQLVEPVLGTRGSFGAALSQKAGAGGQTTHGGPGAAPSREPEPQGHVVAPGLPRAGRRESEPQGHAAAPVLPQAGRQEPGPWDTRACVPCLVFCLDLELIRRVPGSQSNDKFHPDVCPMFWPYFTNQVFN